MRGVKARYRNDGPCGDATFGREFVRDGKTWATRWEIDCKRPK